jgi:hypothetical protein
VKSGKVFGLRKQVLKAASDKRQLRRKIATANDAGFQLNIFRPVID